MRLFTAIALPESAKERLRDQKKALQAAKVRGSFTRKDNLHLTLVFLGQTDKKDEIITALDSLSLPTFSMKVEGLGRFKAQGGDIFWAGVEPSSQLTQLHQAVEGVLAPLGFPRDKRRFTPHITLGRRMRYPRELSLKELSKKFEPTLVSVEKITLFRSQRIEDTLVYIPVYEKELT